MTTPTVSSYIDIWALGVLCLRSLDSSYVDHTFINGNELGYFEQVAFGTNPEIPARGYSEVVARVEDLSRFFSPLIHERTFLKGKGGIVDGEIFGELLQDLLAAPRVRCECGALC